MNRRIKTWHDKPIKERRKNSRNGSAELQDDYITYHKWCENCGKQYETVNGCRKLCDECWQQKCDGNGYRAVRNSNYY